MRICLHVGFTDDHTVNRGDADPVGAEPKKIVSPVHIRKGSTLWNTHQKPRGCGVQGGRMPSLPERLQNSPAQPVNPQ